MTIINRSNKKPVSEGGSTLPSSLSLKAFGEAMAQLDLSVIPPHRRKAALQSHMLRLAAAHIEDRALAAEIYSSYLGHLARNANR